MNIQFFSGSFLLLLIGFPNKFKSLIFFIEIEKEYFLD